ncbi:hypothetical protein D3C86_1452980 [compost metagenome]
MSGRNPLELLENPLLVFFADADAAITDFNPRLAALTVYLHTDRTLGTVAQGVGQQVGNHLFNAKLVPIPDHRMLGFEGHGRFGGINLLRKILQQAANQG